MINGYIKYISYYGKNKYIDEFCTLKEIESHNNYVLCFNLILGLSWAKWSNSCSNVPHFL